MNTQPKNLIRINDPSPNGKNRIVCLWPGPDQGPLAQIRRETVREAEALLRNAYDIRGNRNFGPVEAGTRLREAAGKPLKVLNDAASKLRERKEQARQEVQMLNPVKGYDRTGYWQPMFDLRLIDSYHALPGNKRATMSAEMRREPVMHLAYAEALLRVPREIAGIDEGLRAEIRLGLLKVFKRDEFERLDIEVEQLRATEQALRAVIEAIVDTTGSSADVREHAPNAFTLRMDQSEPLSWLPPEHKPAPQWTPEPEPAEPVGDATGGEPNHAG